MNNVSKKGVRLIGLLPVTAAFLLIAFFILPKAIEYFNNSDGSTVSATSLQKAKETISVFAQEQKLATDDWPEALVELLAGNPETKEFVLNYPVKKDETPEIDLGAYKDSSSVPLFLQWDQRWGYSKYGREVMGISGCGPTCLSMVCVYVLNDTSLDPKSVAQFAERNRYYVPGSGSSWTLISEGGEKLGLDVTELPLDKNIVIRNLKAGDPIICVMGPGDFTATGHYIVMTGYEDGKIRVNDPNSVVRSEKLWEFNAISGQIRNLWVCK